MDTFQPPWHTKTEIAVFRPQLLKSASSVAAPRRSRVQQSRSHQPNSCFGAPARSNGEISVSLLPLGLCCRRQHTVCTDRFSFPEISCALQALSTVLEKTTSLARGVNTAGVQAVAAAIAFASHTYNTTSSYTNCVAKSVATNLSRSSLHLASSAYTTSYKAFNVGYQQSAQMASSAYIASSAMAGSGLKTSTQAASTLYNTSSAALSNLSAITSATASGAYEVLPCCSTPISHPVILSLPLSPSSLPCSLLAIS